MDLYDQKEALFRNVQRGAGINAISSDREGNLWIGYYSDGVARFRQGSFITYTARDGLSDDQVTSVLQDAAGNIWVGTNKGLDLLRDGKFTTHTIPNRKTNRRVNALALDQNGDLWAGPTTACFWSSLTLDAWRNRAGCSSSVSRLAYLRIRVFESFSQIRTEPFGLAPTWMDLSDIKTVSPQSSHRRIGSRMTRFVVSVRTRTAISGLELVAEG